MRPMHSRSRPVVDRQIGLIESEPGGAVLNGFCERELGHGRHALVVGPSLLQTGHKIMGPLEFTYYYLCCPRNSQVDTMQGMRTGTKYACIRRYKTQRVQIQVWVCVRKYGHRYNSKPNGYFQTGLKDETRKPTNNDSCDVLCMRLVHYLLRCICFLK